MKTTAKRFGRAPVPVVVGSAKQGRDSSHGRAMVTPAPRRTVRREIESADFFVLLGILFTSLFCRFCTSSVHELRTCDNRLNQGIESVAICCKSHSHTID